MSLRWFWNAGAGLCLLTAALPWASAQYSRKLEGLIRRPSAEAPSTGVGGLFTREAVRPLELARGSAASLFGQRRFTTRANLRDYRFNRTVGYSQLGFQEDMEAPARNSFLNAMMGATRDRGAAVAVISGLNQATSLNLPLPGVPIGLVPALSACAYTPRAESNRFQDLTGLAPPRPEEAAQLLPTTAERLEARTSDVATWAERDGLSLFKLGTREVRDAQTGQFQKFPDCADKLGRAVQRLRMAIDLNPNAALPALLVAHAALEQERPLLAANELLTALRRDPNLLSGAGGALDRYFGDVAGEGGRSAFLAAQMRRYARLGEFNPNSAPAYVLEAYCTWRLGDVGPARAALARLDELAPGMEKAEADTLRGFAAALRGVLQ
jgi:hypothetical protein